MDQMDVVSVKIEGSEQYTIDNNISANIIVGEDVSTNIPISMDVKSQKKKSKQHDLLSQFSTKPTASFLPVSSSLQSCNLSSSLRPKKKSRSSTHSKKNNTRSHLVNNNKFLNENNNNNNKNENRNINNNNYLEQNEINTDNIRMIVDESERIFELSDIYNNSNNVKKYNEDVYEDHFTQNAANNIYIIPKTTSKTISQSECIPMEIESTMSNNISSTLISSTTSTFAVPEETIQNNVKKNRRSMKHKRGKHSKKEPSAKTILGHPEASVVKTKVDRCFFVCLNSNYILYDFDTDWCPDPIASYEFSCHINALNNSEKDEWWRMFLNDGLLAQQLRTKLESSVEDPELLEEDIEVGQQDENDLDDGENIDNEDEHDVSSSEQDDDD
jgi:hypothetical protein